ncbi:MAG: transposase [Paenibacillus sp.]|nr:transposase [Paenibacillus sp.]
MGKLKTGKDVQRYLESIDIKMEYSTCLKVLKSMGFQAYIKKKKPFLKAEHRKNRLRWAKAHRNWTSDDWRRMVFSDETKINVWGSDGCKYYWKRPDDILRFHHIEMTLKHGGGGIMMWGCITYDGPGYACQIYDGNMKKEDYIHILSTTLKDTMEWYGYNPKAIYFQQDKDPKHTSKATKTWLNENKFNTDWTYSWPSQSPDLNPIEHIWHHLKLKLSSYPTKAVGVHELWERVEEQWATFTKEDCQRYIDSMPKRIEAVIKAKGGPTKY